MVDLVQIFCLSVGEQAQLSEILELSISSKCSYLSFYLMGFSQRVPSRDRAVFRATKQGVHWSVTCNIKVDA